jgi:transcriptional regulator with XRE-family HTH domain
MHITADKILMPLTAPLREPLRLTIAALRSLGLSQNQVARRLCLSRSYLSEMINGIKRPTEAIIDALLTLVEEEAQKRPDRTPTQEAALQRMLEAWQRAETKQQEAFIGLAHGLVAWSQGLIDAKAAGQPLDREEVRAVTGAIRELARLANEEEPPWKRFVAERVA